MSRATKGKRAKVKDPDVLQSTSKYQLGIEIRTNLNNHGLTSPWLYASANLSPTESRITYALAKMMRDEVLPLLGIVPVSFKDSNSARGMGHFQKILVDAVPMLTKYTLPKGKVNTSARPFGKEHRKFIR